LFQAGNLFWTLGASLTGPIFDGATHWYLRKASIEAHDAVLATYQQTVLAALAQVADSLRGLDHDAEAVAAESGAVKASADGLHLTWISYQAGVSTYLEVLIADEQLHQATLGSIQVQAQRLQDTAALYVALGGGWWRAGTAAQAATNPGLMPPGGDGGVGP
jgi:outer membrane protein TolC